MKKKFILIFLLNLIFNINSLDLKFAWWNVKNFFDTTDDLKKDDTIFSKEEYFKKLNLTAEIIALFKADFVGLCEIENIEILKDLAEKTDYPFYYLEDGNDPRGIDVALLSKRKVEYFSNKDLPTPYDSNKDYKFSRDCPYAFFKEGDKSFYILLTHLKSKARDDGNSEKKRIAQSFGILDVISNIYDKENSEPFLLLTGDFNSYRYSEPMNILEKSGLSIINYAYKKIDAYTTKYKGKKEDIDYVVFNRRLSEEGKIVSFKVIRNKQIEKISDHYPILIRITF